MYKQLEIREGVFIGRCNKCLQINKVQGPIDLCACSRCFNVDTVPVQAQRRGGFITWPNIGAFNWTTLPETTGYVNFRRTGGE